MGGLARVCVMLSALLLWVGSSRADMQMTIMTFEDIPGDFQFVNDFYSGVTFISTRSNSTVFPLITRNMIFGTVNASSWPSGAMSGMGQYWFDGLVAVTAVFPDTIDGRITFGNADATFVEVGYSAATSFWLEAYDAGGNLIDQESGAANLRFQHNNPNGMGTLRVEAPSGAYISYVVARGTQNLWVIDNVATDASGIQLAGSEVIPSPAAATLGIIGLSIIGLRRPRRDAGS